MAVPITALQDCQILVKAFEKGCNHALTEESAFAVMTPTLSNMRGMARTTKRLMTEKATTSAASQVKGVSATKTEPEEPFFTKLAGDIADVPGKIVGNIIDPTKITDFLQNPNRGDVLGGILNSECIPCDLRINFKEQLNLQTLLGAAPSIIWAPLEQYFDAAIAQLLSIIDMFKNLGKYVDLCAFLKFLQDFVCIPDLQKILAVLAALLMKLAFELSAVFDLVIALIAPLLLPFLLTISDQLNKFLLLALKPIECIVNAIQNILTKLDYNVLFQNIELTKVQIGAPSVGFSFNLRAPGITGEAASEQAAVNRAESELRALQQSAGGVDRGDPEAVSRHQEQDQEARQNYRDAVQERDLSAIGRANQAISDKFLAFKGALYTLIGYLQQAIEGFQAEIDAILSEFKKLLDQLSGSAGAGILLIGQKLEIIQLVNFVIAIINALTAGKFCEEEGKEVETFQSFLPVQQGFKVWTDEDGGLHIQEDDKNIGDAIDATVVAFGGAPVSQKNPTDDSGNATRQKLKSLIEFTGDSTLDSSISRAVDALTTPTNAVFKCPLQTTVANAEKVNTWIRELNDEK